MKINAIQISGEVGGRSVSIYVESTDEESTEKLFASASKQFDSLNEFDLQYRHYANAVEIVTEHESGVNKASDYLRFKKIKEDFEEKYPEFKIEEEQPEQTEVNTSEEKTQSVN